jgi:hypothetical protein
MTPLAQEIMNARLAGDTSHLWTVKDGEWIHRQFPDPYSYFSDLHFFEVSAVLDAARQNAFKVVTHLSERLAFLPASRTWIEYLEPECSGARLAFRLVRPGGKDYANVEMFTRQQDDGIAYRGLGFRLPLVGSGEVGTFHRVRGSWASEQNDEAGHAFCGLIYTLLGMINTPRIFGRRQHMMHAGLQRKLVAAKPLVGKWPLQAWHELTLEVSPTRIIDSAKEHEAKLTGERALHFVREHLRFRFGMWIQVTEHWRGNGALGIKRTRYSVKPGKDRGGAAYA